MVPDSRNPFSLSKEELKLANPQCTIVFQAEAYDPALAVYERLNGLHVEVYPTEGDPFVGCIGNVPDGEDTDGETLVEFAVVIDGAPTDEVRTLNIYTDIARIEVL